MSAPIEWNVLEELIEKLKLKDIDVDKLHQDYTVLNDVFESIPEELTPDKKWAFFQEGENSDRIAESGIVCFVHSRQQRLS